jgi:hypothetical protein
LLRKNIVPEDGPQLWPKHVGEYTNVIVQQLVLLINLYNKNFMEDVQQDA